jgi:hypothetical protein
LSKTNTRSATSVFSTRKATPTTGWRWPRANCRGWRRLWCG